MKAKICLLLLAIANLQLVASIKSKEETDDMMFDNIANNSEFYTSKKDIISNDFSGFSDISNLIHLDKNESFEFDDIELIKCSSSFINFHIPPFLKLKVIDFSSITEIKFIHLERLDSLKKIIFPKDIEINVIVIEENDLLNTLDFSGIRVIKELKIEMNSSLSNIVFPENIEINEVVIFMNHGLVDTLDLSNIHKIKKLEIKQNRNLSNIIFPKNSVIEGLVIYDNDLLSSLDFSNFKTINLLEFKKSSNTIMSNIIFPIDLKIKKLIVYHIDLLNSFDISIIKTY